MRVMDMELLGVVVWLELSIFYIEMMVCNMVLVVVIGVVLWVFFRV